MVLPPGATWSRRLVRWKVSRQERVSTWLHWPCADLEHYVASSLAKCGLAAHWESKQDAPFAPVSPARCTEVLLGHWGYMGRFSFFLAVIFTFCRLEFVGDRFLIK